MRFVALLVAVTAAPALAHVYIPPAPPEPPPAPAPKKPERTKLLVLDLKPNDVEPSTASTINGVVTSELASYPELDVVSRDDMQRLVQLQADKSTMGCSDDAGCLAEIADSLGAKLVVFGTIGKLGDAYVVNLNLFDADKAAGLGRVVVQAEDTKKLPKKLRPKVHELLGRFYSERGLTLPALPVEKEEPPPAVIVQQEPSSLPWIVAVGGGVTALVGISMAAVGVIPLVQYDDAKARVAAAERGFAKDASTLATAKTAQSDLADARNGWNSAGYLAVDGGASMAIIALPVAVWGLVWALSTPQPPSGAP